MTNSNLLVTKAIKSAFLRNPKNFGNFALAKSTSFYLKQQYIMKNYAIKNLNGWQNVEGKIFLGQELGMTGAEVSLQCLAAGEDAPFLHSHKTHEEIYVIISGKGEYEVDGEKMAVSEGSVIRVAPAGVRALRNTSDNEMVMMCIQYEAKPITSFMDDANIIPLNK